MSRYTLLNRIFPRMMAVLLVLMLLLFLAPAVSAAESGSCGEKLEWSFEGGTLTITGKGRMTDYTESQPAPWYDFRDRIVRLELPKGLTAIGRMAFYECTALTVVEIPEGVQEVGTMAFCGCGELTMLQLPDGLTKIGRSAFEGCERLADLRLPDSLTTMERRAFYSCEALRYVTIPESVVSMGSSCFAYCTGLVRAEVHARLEELPPWTFFGCDSLGSIYLSGATRIVGEYALYDCTQLEVVYYGGTPGDAQELQDQITENREGIGSNSQVSQGEAGNSGSSLGMEQDENGDIIIEDTTVTQTEDSTITTTTETNLGGGESEQQTQIDATIITDEGWQELTDAIGDALEHGGVSVEVCLPGGTEVPAEVLDKLAGEDVRMEVITATGDSYTLNFQDMESTGGKDGLDLSYTLTLVEESRYDELQGYLVYELRFDKSSQVPVGAAIALPVENNRATASLYQVRGGKLEYLQAAVVNEKGVVHFYLATVDKGTTYFVGINIPGISTSDAYIPESLEGEYGITEQIRNVDYVITGRRSSWGMSFLDVNKILIGFMLSTAAIVGLLMYARNKRKLRQGVIPGWEDDEDI